MRLLPNACGPAVCSALFLLLAAAAAAAVSFAFWPRRRRHTLHSRTTLLQGGIPGYCADDFLKAAAGGQYCKQFEGVRRR